MAFANVTEENWKKDLKNKIWNNYGYTAEEALRIIHFLDKESMRCPLGDSPIWTTITMVKDNEEGLKIYLSYICEETKLSTNNENFWRFVDEMKHEMLEEKDKCPNNGQSIVPSTELTVSTVFTKTSQYCPGTVYNILVLIFIDLYLRNKNTKLFIKIVIYCKLVYYRKVVRSTIVKHTFK